MESPAEQLQRLQINDQQQEHLEPRHYDDHIPTCPICLDVTEPVDLAYVKNCQHTYCVNCILGWALMKETPVCPQCKGPFNYLYTYRLLDGTMSDFPVEESVCLLKRARWFQEHLERSEKGKAPVSATDVQELGDFYDDDYQEIEDYYFSSAAGSARVVIGNRRWGENGYMRSGRQYARPAQPSSSAGTKAKCPKAGSGCTKPVEPGKEVSAPNSSQQGRRAKRAAKRAAADARG